MNKQQSQWIPFIKKTTLNNGTFEAKDAQGLPIVLEWTKTDIQSLDLAAFKKSICDLASQVLADSEVQFLRKFPDAVSQEMFLQPCAPLFEQGVQSVNWQKVEEQIKTTVKQFYLTDISAFGAEVIKPLLNDIYFYVILKNRGKDQILGFLMFAITPALEFGNIKIIHLALLPSEQDRGLEKLLMSSIFKIVEEVKRLFIYVRPTNEHDINMYTAWGFHQELNPIQDPNHKVNMDYLILMEYKTECSKSLQETAKTLDAKK